MSCVRGMSPAELRDLCLSFPGYHLNKRHWNTVIIDGSLPDETIHDMIEDSYDLVVSKLPQASRRALGRRGEA
jgi:predicted DNA-binding protein (MmcQ/YjbR family)